MTEISSIGLSLPVGTFCFYFHQIEGPRSLIGFLLRGRLVQSSPTALLFYKVILSSYRNSCRLRTSLPFQQFGSASSYGKKYALGNLFLIDDTADSDATNDHGKKKFTPSKPTLTSKTDPAYEKAVQYVTAGGKVSAIKAKYALSKEIEGALTTL